MVTLQIPLQLVQMVNKLSVQKKTTVNANIKATLPL